MPGVEEVDVEYYEDIGDNLIPITDTPAAITYSSSITDTEACILAQIVYAEARGVKDQAHQAAVIWCILNRVDAGMGTITEVCKAPNQFAYRPDSPTVDDYGRDLIDLAYDVTGRWQAEKENSDIDIGRVLPQEFLFFSADGTGIDNRFRTNFTKPYEVWDWSLPSPYDAE